jgi:hypothetical protein
MQQHQLADMRVVLDDEDAAARFIDRVMDGHVHQCSGRCGIWSGVTDLSWHSL